MIVRRNIVIVLIIVLMLGLFLQTVRTDYFFNMIGNSNNSFDFSVNDTTAAPVVNLKSDESIIKQNVLLLSDMNDPESLLLVKNISMVLKYMKKEYSVKDINKDQFNYSEYWMVIVTISDLNKLIGFDKIPPYVQNGGNVFFAVNCQVNEAYYQIYRKLGIIEIGTPQIFKGVKLLDNILIKGKGLEVDENYIENYGLTVSLDNRIVRVHTVSKENAPILWDASYGIGKFMVNNGTMFSRKECRGLIAGAISLMCDDFIYPIINMKIAYIDDFPAPLPKGYNDRLKLEYNRTIDAFFRDVWWPDIFKSAAINNLKYTALMIETYNNLTYPPFDGVNRGDKQNLIIYGREIINSGGEIGIHGYNHQSLAMPGYIKNEIGYKSWRNESYMQAALKEVSVYFRSAFPYYDFRVYVPPSNILSPEGRKALLSAIPSVKIISSVYHKDAQDDQYDQEFEKSADGIIEMPRISSGYLKKEYILWDEYNSITMMGVFSHFIHPDDVLDAKRNQNKSWAELYKHYNEFMGDIHSNFSWLRAMTATQGGNALSKSIDSNFEFIKTKTGIAGYCDKMFKDNYFILRSTKNVQPDKNCKVIKIDDNMYLINATEPDFSINLTVKGG